jgi:diguanylate cyclase (GGDEF)-like protein/PAS domain S-box-containing protein
VSKGINAVKDESKTKKQLINELIETRQEITRLKASQENFEELRQSERLYRLLAENISDVIWIMDLSLRYTYFSPSVAGLRGYTAEEATALTLQETLTPASLQIAIKALGDEVAIENRGAGNLSRTRILEVEEFCKDGSTVWVETKISFLRDQSNILTGILGVTRNITERKQAEENIKHLAFYDPVSGLPNRILFNDRITTAVRNARRYKKQLAVMMLDLDRFKDINDTYGHSLGDRLLNSVGTRIAGRLRESDTVSRIGGDEFMVLLPDIHGQGDAAIVAQKIIVAFQEPFVIEGREIHITTSIGVCAYPQHGNSADTLIKNADNAMYQAKALGRNNWQWFESRER